MNVNSSPIALNSQMSIELVDSNGGVEHLELIIVDSRRADFKSGLLDENTPLARLLIGHHAGETLAYNAGDLRSVRILSVVDNAGILSSEAAHKRRQAVENAAAQSEITSQMIFASASGSKWGDYEVNMDDLLEGEERGENEEE